MYHPKMQEWDRKLNSLFEEIDDYLEDTYGHLYPLHPRRPPRGSTANNSMDGLFNVGAAFSAGYGSQHGRGYVIDVEMRTLADVPADVIEEIEDDVVEQVSSRLPRYFPARDISVKRDGNVFKISGDFGLGVL